MKYEIQTIAEQMAEDRGVDFYNLSLDRQCSLYESATEYWTEKQMLTAELMSDMLGIEELRVN